MRTLSRGDKAARRELPHPLLRSPPRAEEVGGHLGRLGVRAGDAVRAELGHDDGFAEAGVQLVQLARDSLRSRCSPA
jgi:hypothetical protein